MLVPLGRFMTTTMNEEGGDASGFAAGLAALVVRCCPW
jgi:hypothetical protein